MASTLKKGRVSHKQSANNFGRLRPARFVKRFAEKIAAAADGRPILDVASGSGRNAMAFAELMCDVICVDRTFHRFETEWSNYPSAIRKRLTIRESDLVNDQWPFGKHVFGAIIDIDFLLPALFPHFVFSLAPGGYLLLETVSGRGGNYLELPVAGAVRCGLKDAFYLELYEERKVGPLDYDSVAVKVLGKRNK
jgi:hypothetical protein